MPKNGVAGRCFHSVKKDNDRIQEMIVRRPVSVFHLHPEKWPVGQTEQ